MRGGQALEYLSQVLSQRGPQAVSYDEGNKWTIREHLSELLKVFPNLSIKVGEFHANNGRILNLVKAEGTVPIHYQAAKYNIPVMVWLPERYPQQPPLVYVCPTPNMIIKAGHSFVDPSGLARSPCLAHWLPSSDLSSAMQEMAMLFSAEPPLYTKPAGYVPPPPPAAAPGGPSSSSSGSATPYGGTYGQPPPGSPQPQPPPAQQQQQALGGGGGGFFGHLLGRHQPQQQPQQQQQQQQDPGQALWGGAYAAAAAAAGGGSSGSRPPEPPGAAAAAAGPYGGGLPPDPKQVQVDATKAQFQGLAARALAGRLQAGLEAYNRHATEEMDGLLEVQRTLMARERQLQELVASIQQERLGTEGLVAELGRQSGALEAWLASHEWKADAVAGALARGGSDSGGLDVNKVVVPADDLSRQALQAQAEDLAVEDTLLVLEKALLQGKLTPEVYMKQVRLLCRRQFLARALGLKVAAAQRQQQRTSIASSQGAPYTMTHGDTWSHR